MIGKRSKERKEEKERGRLEGKEREIEGYEAPILWPSDVKS